MIEHLFHNGCGERDALLALVSDWPIIGYYLRGLLARLRRKRRGPKTPVVKIRRDTQSMTETLRGRGVAWGRLSPRGKR